MKRLAPFDFAQRRHLPVPGIAFAVVGALLLLASAAAAWRFERDNAMLADHVKAAAAARAPRTAMSTADRLLLAQARTVVSQLNAPWDDLLAVFEEHSTSKVGLLKLEPDAKAALVRVTAQAADVDAMVAYVRALEGDTRLSDVILANHQVDREIAGRPVRFMLVANWRLSVTAGTPPTRVAKASS